MGILNDGLSFYIAWTELKLYGEELLVHILIKQLKKMNQIVTKRTMSLWQNC